MKLKTYKNQKILRMRLLLVLLIALCFLVTEALAYSTADYVKLRKKVERKENGKKSAFRFDWGFNYYYFPITNDSQQGNLQEGGGTDLNFSFIYRGVNQFGLGLGARYWSQSIDLSSFNNAINGIDVSEGELPKMDVHLLGLFVAFQHKVLFRWDPIILAIGSGYGYTVMSSFTDDSFSVEKIFFPKEDGDSFLTIYPGIDLSFSRISGFVFTMFVDYRILINTKMFSGAANTILQDSYIETGIRFGKFVYF